MLRTFFLRKHGSNSPKIAVGWKTPWEDFLDVECADNSRACDETNFKKATGNFEDIAVHEESSRI